MEIQFEQDHVTLKSNTIEEALFFSELFVRDTMNNFKTELPPLPQTKLPLITKDGRRSLAPIPCPKCHKMFRGDAALGSHLRVHKRKMPRVKPVVEEAPVAQVPVSQ